MFFIILIVIFTIAYAYSQRENPIRITYAGGVLLALALVGFILLSIVPSSVTTGSQAETNTIMISLLGILVLFPSGVIMAIIGLVLDRKNQENG